jgi:protein-tyrosine phosphatase
MVKVLFVCTGNICRSPTAEGVFRALLAREGLDGRVGVDSAGTHAYHVGEPPDRRSIQTARRHGVDLSGQRARQVTAEDFETFDLIVSMDRGHHEILRRRCPTAHVEKLALFLAFAPEFGLLDVPDPYYGEGDGFERVFEMTEAGARGLLAHLREELL